MEHVGLNSRIPELLQWWRQEALTHAPDLLRGCFALQNGMSSIVHVSVEKHHQEF